MIEYNKHNMFKCKCLVCPVQEDSQSAKMELDRLLSGTEIQDICQEFVDGISDFLLPEPSRSPAVYCAENVCGASHLDMNYNQNCMCKNCIIKETHNLAGGFHCMNGC